MAKDPEARLKRHLQELGAAMNEALANSDGIGEALTKLKRAGYDIYLALEVTVGYKKVEDGDSGDDPQKNTVVTFQPNSQDKKFLRQIKISPE